MPHVAILIVNYNGEPETRECLESLRKIKKDDFDVSIVVVDNGSKEVLSIPEKVLPAQTTILRSDANLGFTSGNNLALKHALENSNPDYILLLNNDTTVHPDFLTELVSCAKNNKNVGIVVPKIYFSAGREYHHESYSEKEKGKVLWYAGGSIDWRNFDAFHRGVDEIDRGHFDVELGSEAESDFATGCCALIPRTVIDRVGFFDPRYFLYLEDVDLSIRIKQAGYRILFCPNSVIWHKNAGSSGGAGSALHQYYQTRNRLFFFLKYRKEAVLSVKNYVPDFAPADKKEAQVKTISFSEDVKKIGQVLKFAVRLLVFGNGIERRAVIDWAVGRMGKQTVF